VEAFILPLLFLLPLILIFSRTRRQQREFQLVQQRLAAGQEVMTTAGLYATVVDVGQDAVLLESAPGVRQRWARAAVARIVTDPEADAAAAADAAEDADSHAAAVGGAEGIGTAGPLGAAPPEGRPTGGPTADPADGPAEGRSGAPSPRDERRRDDGSP
jgi:preprotein translocase subunit YajC